MIKSSWIIAVPDWATCIDQGGMGGGVTVVPNPWDKSTVGYKVQYDYLFVQNINFRNG